MQTFLPYSDYYRCAEVLDYRRLGKQRVECKQILQALQGGGGWSKHPAVAMWRGYERSLEDYQAACIAEWVRRGYNNTMTAIVRSRASKAPWWLGDERMHSAHRAALLFKDPGHYGRFGWSETPGLDYWWPVPRN